VTSRKKPYGEVWTPPADDKVSPPQTLPADFDGWDDAPAPIPVAQQQAKARAKRTANVPGWQEAIFPNMTAAGGNPMQDLRTFGAGFKDLAALPANLASGAVAAIAAHPGDASQDARYAMASKGQGDMDQNQRAVLGLSMAGGPIGKAFERALPTIRSSAPLMRGLARLVRGGGAGVAESVPAATFQAAIGDFGGGMENLAIGGAAGGLMRGVGLIPKSIDKAAGNMAGSMSGIPQRDLRKIGFLGNSEYGQKILSVAGNREELLNKLGKELIDRAVVNFDAYLPDAAKVDAIVENLPPIDGKRIISALEKAKPPVKATPEGRTATSGIDDLMSIAAESMDANGMIPAKVARQIRQEYDATIGDAFGKQSKSYINALKNGRHEIAQALEDVAKDKPEYAQAMQNYTKLYRARNKVFEDLGFDENTQSKRVDAYLSNLFQGTKAEKQARLKELSELLGEDFAGRAKLLSDAKRIAPTGEIPLVSAHNTGKAGMGGGIVGGIGGLMYGLGSGNPGLMAASAGTLGLSALGSPALAPGILWGTEKAAQAAANPYARGLSGLAGRSARSWLQAENAGQ